MRRMLVSRSSLEKPRPLERLVRISSPSRTSTRWPRARSSSATRFASVDLPAPDIPVNHRVKPLTHVRLKDSSKNRLLVEPSKLLNRLGHDKSAHPNGGQAGTLTWLALLAALSREKAGEGLELRSAVCTSPAAFAGEAARLQPRGEGAGSPSGPPTASEGHCDIAGNPRPSRKMGRGRSAASISAR